MEWARGIVSLQRPSNPFDIERDRLSFLECFRDGLLVLVDKVIPHAVVLRQKFLDVALFDYVIEVQIKAKPDCHADVWVKRFHVEIL
jgi:hypothetical protein